MQEPPSYEQLYETYVLWRRCASLTLSARSKELRKNGANPPRFAIINAIKHLGGEPSLSEISRWLFGERNTIKEMVDRMERDGLVTRRKAHQGVNRKLVYVSLTDKGEKIYNKGKHSKVISNIMSSLSHEQLEEFAKTLELLKDKGISETNSS